MPEITTRHDSKEYLQGVTRRMTPLTKQQRHQAISAHHNIMERRDRLGMPKIKLGHQVGGPVVGQNYKNLASFSGWILSLVGGLQYNQNGGTSSCYDAFESAVIGLDTTTDIFAKLYIPAFWSEGQVQMQDLVSVTSAVFVDCNIDKMFGTMSHLATVEGLSELGGRSLGAWPYEISTAIDTFSNSDNYTYQESGYNYGRLISIVLNFTI